MTISVEALRLEAVRQFGRERAELLRPLLNQLAEDLEQMTRVELREDEEP